jgi:hypothetical protein
LLQANLSEEKMQKMIVISKREFDELKLLVDDLKLFIEILGPQIQPECETLSEYFDPYSTETDLNQIF